MKIRTGFVSNSSSSSFIIGIKDINGVKEYDAPNWVSKLVNKLISSFSSGDQIKNIKELDDHFIDKYGWKDVTLSELFKDDEYIEKEYNKMLKAVEEGYIVVDCEVDYSEEGRADFYGSLPDKDEGDGIYLIDSEC